MLLLMIELWLRGGYEALAGHQTKSHLNTIDLPTHHVTLNLTQSQCLTHMLSGPTAILRCTSHCTLCPPSYYA